MLSFGGSLLNLGSKGSLHRKHCGCHKLPQATGLASFTIESQRSSMRAESFEYAGGVRAC